MEGLWGTALRRFVIYPLAYILPCNDVDGCFENPWNDFYMISLSQVLPMLVIGFVLTVTGCIYIHRHTHTCIYIHLHTLTYTYMHIHAYTYTYIHLHALTCTYIYIHIYVNIYSCIHVFIHTYTYKHTCLCIYILIHNTLDSIQLLRYLRDKLSFICVACYIG